MGKGCCASHYPFWCTISWCGIQWNRGITDTGYSFLNYLFGFDCCPRLLIVLMVRSCRLAFHALLLCVLQKKHILGFKCESRAAALSLWRWAVDRYCFFTWVAFASGGSVCTVAEWGDVSSYLPQWLSGAWCVNQKYLRSRQRGA